VRVRAASSAVASESSWPRNVDACKWPRSCGYARRACSGRGERELVAALVGLCNVQVTSIHRRGRDRARARGEQRPWRPRARASAHNQRQSDACLGPDRGGVAT
jgi:hypothetical protein